MGVSLVLRFRPSSCVPFSSPLLATHHAHARARTHVHTHHRRARHAPPRKTRRPRQRRRHKRRRRRAEWQTGNRAPQHYRPVVNFLGPALHHRWRLPGGARRRTVGCAPLVASWWRCRSPRSRRCIGSSISSFSLETLQARVKQQRRSRNTLQATGPSRSLFPRG